MLFSNTCYNIEMEIQTVMPHTYIRCPLFSKFEKYQRGAPFVRCEFLFKRKIYSRFSEISEVDRALLKSLVDLR